MKIAFFTEAGYFGKVFRENPNMRTDQAWVCALNAVHIPIFGNISIKENFDIGIVIIPKEKNRENLAKSSKPLIKEIKLICNKVYVMQESIQWDWQDESFESMAWFYTQLVESDGVLCHNDVDVPFFSGITNKPAFILPTLMIDDVVKISETKENKVFVAGNWTSTYRGFDAWAIACEFDLPMAGYKTGKFKKGEENNGVDYIPWMIWKDFMFELSKYKYAVQCYPASAGQFPLNCSYLGIPCIGYNDVNTQKYLHPNLSVERGDIVSAKNLVNKLKNDYVFYEECSNITKKLYNDLYSESIFIEKTKEFLK